MDKNKIYKDVLIRIMRIRNICNRVMNSAKTTELEWYYFRSSEKKNIKESLPIIFEQLKVLNDESDKVGFVLLSMMHHLGMRVDDFDIQHCSKEWKYLLAIGQEHAFNGLIDMNRYHEYVSGLWEMMDLPFDEFSGRMMLFKLSLV